MIWTCSHAIVFATCTCGETDELFEFDGWEREWTCPCCGKRWAVELHVKEQAS